MSKTNVIAANVNAVLIKLPEGGCVIRDGANGRDLGKGNGPTQAWADAWTNMQRPAPAPAPKVTPKTETMPRLAAPSLRPAPPSFSPEFRKMQALGGRFGKPVKKHAAFL